MHHEKKSHWTCFRTARNYKKNDNRAALFERKHNIYYMYLKIKQLLIFVNLLHRTSYLKIKDTINRPEILNSIENDERY